MTGVVFKTREEAQEFLDSINKNVGFMFKGQTNSYSYIIEHKDGHKFAVPVIVDDMKMIDNLHPELIDNIGRKYIQEIVFIPYIEWFGKSPI